MLHQAPARAQEVVVQRRPWEDAYVATLHVEQWKIQSRISTSQHALDRCLTNIGAIQSAIDNLPPGAAPAADQSPAPAGSPTLDQFPLFEPSEDAPAKIRLDPPPSMARDVNMARSLGKFDVGDKVRVMEGKYSITDGMIIESSTKGWWSVSIEQYEKPCKIRKSNLLLLELAVKPEPPVFGAAAALLMSGRVIRKSFPGYGNLDGHVVDHRNAEGLFQVVWSDESVTFVGPSEIERRTVVA